MAEALKGLKSQSFVVYLDANFKGYTVPGDKTIAEPSFTDKPFAEFRGELGSDDEGESRTPGRVVFLADRPNSTPLDGPEHGIFAAALLEGLKGAADDDGKEADGLVTVDELAKYLGNKVPELARKYGKTEKEKEQVVIVLGSPNSHFVLSHNPGPYKKAQERVAKFDNAHQGQQGPGRRRRRGAAIPHAHAAPGGPARAAQGLPEARRRRPVADGVRQGPHHGPRQDQAGPERRRQVRGRGDRRDEDHPFRLLQGGKSGRTGDAGRSVSSTSTWKRRCRTPIEARLAKAKTASEDDLKQLLIDARTALGEREDLDKDKDIDVALVEMLQTLDPYTTYIDPETLNSFKINVQGNFTGIGIQIRKDAASDLLLVVTPIKGSPAYKAGILAGDLITQISRDVDENGKPIPNAPGRDLDQGPGGRRRRQEDPRPAQGTKVKLTVQREGSDKPLEFEITRGHVEVETVFGVKRKSNDEWDYLLDPEKKIGYIRLSQFQEESYDHIVAAMADLKKQGMKGLILDLRFDPGGLLNDAIDISDLFIDDGVIVSIRPRGKAGGVPVHGKHEGSLLDFPMVVLVNGESASASEIVSACLQDHHRAYIIGERSFGKGSVQNIRAFGNGKMKLTTATFWRPSGKNLYKRDPEALKSDTWGVKPDEAVPLPEKERTELFDHLRNNEVIPRRDIKPKETPTGVQGQQLEKAVEYLGGQIKTASANPVKKAG